jgi:hypothetical protein
VGGHEGVGPLQAGQDPLAVPTAGEGVGQVAVQLLHDAGPEEEAAQLLRLPVQHLPDEVVGDALVVAGELGHEAVRVRLVLQRQCRQAQPRRPAFGARLQQRRIVLGQARLELVPGQQVDHLGDGERQVGRAELREPSADP